MEEGASNERNEEERKEKKKSGKISRLVRRRESKRDRIGQEQQQQQQQQPTTSNNNRQKFPHKLEKNEASSDNDSSTYYSTVKTFESVFGHEQKSGESGESGVVITEVTLRIKGRKRIADPSRGLVEQMMGVVPVGPKGASNSMDEVVIGGFLPQGQAIKMASEGKLRVGDVIRLVNGHQVNLATIEQLLSTFSSSAKVKITLQRLKSPPANLVLLQSNGTSSESESESRLKSNFDPPSVSRMLSGPIPTPEEVISVLK